MVKLKELFEIKYGNQFDLLKMDVSYSKDSINFVSRTSHNSGVAARVSKIPSIEPFPEGIITVTLGGSYLLSSFVQQKPFYTAQNIKVLIPKKKMSIYGKLYYCLCISKNRFKYASHGREANKTLDDLLVPSQEEIPAWIDTIQFPGPPSKEPYQQKKLSLQSRKWKWFKYKEIFFVESGKGSNIYDLDFNGKCPYISSISVNNGIIGLINSEKSDIHNGNTITINRTGSVGEAFYQKYSYVASKDRIRVLIPKFLMTDFSGMFLATLIQKEKYRFNYGRTWGTSRIKESLIKLPVNEQGEPDWQFMEDYVKSLPYSKNLEAEQKISERKVW